MVAEPDLPSKCAAVLIIEIVIGDNPLRRTPVRQRISFRGLRKSQLSRWHCIATGADPWSDNFPRRCQQLRWSSRLRTVMISSHIVVGYVLRHCTSGGFSSLLQTTRYTCSDLNDCAERRQCENLFEDETLAREMISSCFHVQPLLSQEDGPTIHVLMFNLSTTDIVYEQIEALKPEQWFAYFAIFCVQV